MNRLNYIQYIQIQHIRTVLSDNSLRCDKCHWDNRKGVIKSCESKDRQCNGQKEKDKRTNNGLQNTTQKTYN